MSNYTLSWISSLFIFLFGVLRPFQHCTGHITTGSWKGRGNPYIEFVRVLYCKLQTNGKQLPAFPHEAVTGIEPRPQRWEARVLPLCHRGPISSLVIQFTSVRVHHKKYIYKKDFVSTLHTHNKFTVKLSNHSPYITHFEH